MKKMMYSGLAFLIVTALICDTAVAQNRQGMKNNKQMYSRNYDLNSVETLQGEITEVVTMPGKKRTGMEGVHLMLKTGETILPVHLGPVWYMEQQEYAFKEGDSITVTGSRITFNNAPALIAARVNKGEMVLELRDRNGMPYWRGWRMGSAMNK